MSAAAVSSERWAPARRARVRVRLGPFVLVGRFARVPARSPPPARLVWGVRVEHGRVGYGAVSERGEVEHWRPLPPRE